jgi:hypothetical protein
MSAFFLFFFIHKIISSNLNGLAPELYFWLMELALLKLCPSELHDILLFVQHICLIIVITPTNTMVT